MGGSRIEKYLDKSTCGKRQYCNLYVVALITQWYDICTCWSLPRTIVALKRVAFESNLTIPRLKPEEGVANHTLARGQARIDMQAVVLNLFRSYREASCRGQDIL